MSDNAIYFVKYDGDEVASHPWTLVRAIVNSDAKVWITGAIQLTKNRTASDVLGILREHQQGFINWFLDMDAIDANAQV